MTQWTLHNSNSWGPEKNVRVILSFELDDVFWMGKRRGSLGELYVLCDNSSYNCSSYAAFTVFSDPAPGIADPSQESADKPPGPILGFVQPYMDQIITSLPAEYQTILANKPIGLPPAYTVLVIIISTLATLVASCCCMFGVSANLYQFKHVCRPTRKLRNSIPQFGKTFLNMADQSAVAWFF